MKKMLLFLVHGLLVYSLQAQIAVSRDGHFLTQKNGQPFFWLGDTDWELFHRLNREETIEFLDIRQKQGFNVLQVVALAEFQGLGTPNRYGDFPLIGLDPGHLAITPGDDPSDSAAYDYWDHIDFVIKEAAKRNMYIGLLPTWGDKVTSLWGDGPKIFDSVNAYTYVKWLAQRYANQWNILWILGGDRPVLYQTKWNGRDTTMDDRPIWRAMAHALQDVLGKSVFITYHPSGSRTAVTSMQLKDEAWLTMNAMQTGHGARETEVWNWVAYDYQMMPPKPTLDMEPCYEDHPVNPWDGKWTRQRGYFFAYDVRLRTYRGLFAGSCGVTYGDHQVWQFLDPARYAPINIGDTIIGWKKALHSEAAGQMQFLKKLMLSRPYFSRIPDPEIIVSDRGSSYIDYVSATRDANGSFAMIHLPQNKPVTVNLDKINGKRKSITWYDPRTGKSIPAPAVQGKGAMRFTPPKQGRDWVLIIDDASRNYPAP